MTGNREIRGTPGADDAIDAVVRALVSVEAPADLRARVLARIPEPLAPRAWWTPARVGWAGAAAAVILVAYVAWPRTSIPVVGPIPAATATPAPLPPLVATRPETEEGPGARKVLERSLASGPIVRAGRESPAGPYQFVMPPVVAPLEKPSRVVIEPLAEPQVAIEPLDIEPLSFTPVTIEPLTADR